MVSKKQDLLACSTNELPEKEFTTKSKKTVKVRALKGLDALRVSSMQNLDERILFALPKMLIEPQLTNREIKLLVDNDPDTATEIFIEGLELSNALGEAESAEYEIAKKN
jgi:hypothetical protein